MFEFLQKNCAWLFIHNQWLVQTEWHPSRWHWLLSLHWHHNGRDSVSNRQPRDCLLNRLFRRRSKKTSKLRVTGLCAGNSPGTGEFPAQMASNAENVSIWWRHHVVIEGVAEFNSTGYNEFVSLWSYALEITRICCHEYNNCNWAPPDLGRIHSTALKNIVRWAKAYLKLVDSH